MSIYTESSNLEQKTYNLFPTPLTYKNVGTDLVTEELVYQTQEEISN